VLQDILGFYGVADGSSPEIPAKAVKMKEGMKNCRMATQ